MNLTPIEWTTFSANPLKYRDAAGKVVWGCVHASLGCQHCYSEALAHRYGRGGPFNVPTMNGLTPFLDDAELHKMRTAKVIEGTPVAGSRCFIGDMTDVLGEWVSDDLLNRLFSQTLELRTDVTWQILTKRAKRLREYLSWRWGGGRIPSRHIHIGVSAENQEWYDKRIGDLLRTPARVRFLSLEPLLGPIDLRMGGNSIPDYSAHDPLPAIDWVIVGGESGAHARPMEVAWLRSVVQQCKKANVPCFVKQLGSQVTDRNDAGFEGDPGDSWTPETRYRELTPQQWQGDPVRILLRSRKGGNMSEFPPDLRVRQFPTSPQKERQ
jgi:protein gp37